MIAEFYKGFVIEHLEPGFVVTSSEESDPVTRVDRNTRRIGDVAILDSVDAAKRYIDDLTKEIDRDA